MYEWFYSTLDRDFFNESEFRACLRLMGLDHVSVVINVQCTSHSGAHAVVAVRIFGGLTSSRI